MDLEKYIGLHSKSPFLIQNKKDFEHLKAHQSIGHILGNTLSILVQALAPHKVLEIGTMIGYSTIALAQQLKDNAKIYTIEKRENDFEQAKRNFKTYGVENKIIPLCGDATEIINTLNEKWDFVFLDADKINYINYYNLIFPNLNKNGIIIADNTLFHHKVLDKNDQSKNVKAIKAFNEFIQKDSRVNNVLLNIRDGIQLIIKK